MKRCPKCNQVFDEEWLRFCTNDGTSLIETSSLPPEPPPTMMSPPMPPSVSPSEQPTINLQTGGVKQPPAPYRPPPPMQQPWQPSPQPMQPGWRPPPPPRVAVGPQQGLAVASLILGIFTVTFGWCYVGVVTGPIAIVLGIIALVQIKNNPEKHAGKPMAITGIVTGAVYFLIVAIFILIAIAMQGAK